MPPIDLGRGAGNNGEALASASNAWQLSRSNIRGTSMPHFNRKVGEASARVNKSVAEAAERLEKETAEFITYLNNEVVPAVRPRSTKALRIASEKLAQMAKYLEEHQKQPK